MKETGKTAGPLRKVIVKTCFLYPNSQMPSPPLEAPLLGGGRGKGIVGWGRLEQAAPSCKRELLSAAAVRDKAESSQTPRMINDLWPRREEAW